ncbi:MAG: alpha-E domain-containing protein [Myxococcales bacterium]|nr:alpha-E domain-containing protein [Myxococcales bacterium]
MISRVAECCFWMHRYVERAESTARLLGSSALAADAETPRAVRWQPILTVTGEVDPFGARFGEDHTPTRGEVLEWLTWSPDCAVSIWSSWRMARENARVIRSAISRETWDATNQTWLWLQSSDARRLYDEDAPEFFHRMRDAGHLFSGVTANTMLDDEPLWFMQLGMTLERANQIARIIDVKYHAAGPTGRDKDEDVRELALWVQVLLACGAYESFFKRNRGTIRGYRVARFLVFDPQLPRSITFLLARAADLVSRIESSTGRPATHVSPVLAAVRADLAAQGWEGVVDAGVHETMTRVVDDTAAVGAALYADYFAP